MSIHAEIQVGQSIDSPIHKLGDYYRILRELITEGQNVYFVLNKMVFYLDNTQRTLELVRVTTDDVITSLSAVAQTMALAQKVDYRAIAKDDILEARFQAPKLKSLLK